MNILNLLNYSPEFGGGIAKLLLGLGKVAKINGHKLYLGFPARREWQNELSLSSEIIIIPEIKDALGFRFPRVIRTICDNHSINIMHMHFEFALALSLASSIKKFEIPVIYHWHNVPIALNSFLTPQRNIKGRLKKIISGMIARYTDRRILKQHISISKEITRLLELNNWTQTEKITFLPNGIPKVGHQQVVPKLKLNSIPIIGTVANFRPQKDHETLLNAFSILFNKGVHSELWIIGDGPTRKNMENLANELGVSSKVKFLGTIENTEEMYKSFDIFVLSTHFEGHPLVVLEAMSYGLPIIASRVSSIPDVLTHGESGLLVNPRDAQDLAAALQNLIMDETLYTKLSAAARKNFQQQLSIEEWSNRLINLYQRILT